MATVKTTRKITPAADRFWAKVQKTDGCWLWAGYCNSQGHGVFWSAHGKSRVASRFAWELAHGPIPKGLFVLHRCPGGENPRCVNVEHLYLGTIRENARDMLRGPRAPLGDRHWSRRMPYLIARGNDRWWSIRLRAEDIPTIRSEYARGVTSIVLAKRFHVSPRTIRDAVRRITWGHIV